ERVRARASWEELSAEAADFSRFGIIPTFPSSLQPVQPINPSGSARAGREWLAVRPDGSRPEGRIRMSFSSLTLTLMLLAGGSAQVEAPPHAINRRDIKIPIEIGADQRALMKELILYVSPDQGKTWQQEAVVAPDKDHFRFFAAGDGQYWFTVVVVDQQGRRQPED